jgi:transcriptional regulator with XRE-family HTH domain
MNTINQRIKEFLFLKGMKHKDVARQTGINVQQFNNWCNNTKPTLDGLVNIIKFFPDMNTRWLFTGDGDPICIVDEKNKNIKTKNELETLIINLNGDINFLKNILLNDEDFIRSIEKRIEKVSAGDQ